MTNQRRLSRRIFLGGGIGIVGLASNLLALSAGPKGAYASSATFRMVDIGSVSSKASAPTSSFAGLPFMGVLDPKANGFDPGKILTVFNEGKVSKLPTGQTLREYTLTAINKTILVAPGKQFDALAYNGQVPGPTLRATQGDHVRITFINKSNIAHGMHFTGIRLGTVDALTQPVAPGDQMVYEFDAQPFGLYLYQSFTTPLNTHAFKGLYGTLIIDPPQPRPRAQELFMTLNGFVLDSKGQDDKPGSDDDKDPKPSSADDKDPKPSSADDKDPKSGSDDDKDPKPGSADDKDPKPGSDDDDDGDSPESNNVYAINTVAYHFIKNPITIPKNQLIRVYLVNVTEFDLVNSFHLHGNLFNIYRSGTSLKPNGSDSTIMLAPGQRAILEFSFRSPGQYMFHAYQGEYADQGCMGIFNVK